MFTYLPTYSVLVCNKHQYAVHSLDKHLRQHHKLPATAQRELLAAYAHLSL
jgi:hypothetical protein